MAEEKQKSAAKRPAAAAKKPKSAAKRKKKRRNGKARGNGIRTILIIVLALGLLALVAVLLQERQTEPPVTIETYPMEYTDLIRWEAQTNGIDPAYVAAIIMAESSYNPDAVSSVNAQGLMQIMPETGKWIAGKFGEEYTDGCLFDPETNIRYGCWYLGYLVDRFDGDLTCSTAAYHSGQGTVDKWLSDPQYSADGTSLDVIPGQEAEKYVNRVLKYYEKYKELYADS